MPSFDYTVEMERHLLRQLTSSGMMARMFLSRVSEEMFTSVERRFILAEAKAVLESSKAALTRPVFEYEVRSRVADTDVAYFLSEWNLIEGLDGGEPPDVLIDKLTEANVGRRTLAIAEEVVGLLEKGSVAEAVQHLKRQSMLVESKKDDRPMVELTDYQHRIKLIEDKRANPEKYLGMKIGMPTYDKHTGGVFKGEMLLIAGITGLGKSTLCKQLCKNIVTLNPGKNVLHIANEEYLEQVEHKYDAMISEVPYDDFKRATISEEDSAKWLKEMEKMKGARYGRIFLKEVPAFTDITLIEKAYRDLENLGVRIDVIIIDHLPHVMPVQKAWGENDERAKAASEVKELARWLKVAIIIPTQAATEVEEKTNKGRRAGKMDVYGSKGQVHVANVFLIITYKGSDEDQEDKPEYLRDVYLLCDVKKNRDGPPFFFLAKHRVSVGVVQEIDKENAKSEAAAAVAEVEGKVRDSSMKAMEAVEGVVGPQEGEGSPEVAGAIGRALGEAGEVQEVPGGRASPEVSESVVARARRLMRERAKA